jgi:hypothetical protein
MDDDTYASIGDVLSSVPVTAVPCFKLLAKQHGVSEETVYSIYSQEVQYRVMRTHKDLCNASVELMRRYAKGMMAISWKFCRAPCRFGFKRITGHFVCRRLSYIGLVS